MEAFTHPPIYRGNLASFRERNIELQLPFPIQKVVLTHATLCDLAHPIHLIQLRSIAVYNVHAQRILYIQDLTAVASPHHPYSALLPPYIGAVFADPIPMAGRGFNTFHGFDTGPPPPGFPSAQPNYAAMFPPQPTFPASQPIFAPMAQVPFSAPTLVNPPAIAGLYPPGWVGQAHPAMAPVVNNMFPGVHLRNHTGGVGLPPGYDYAFPQEHTKIHVFKTGPTPPWRQILWAGDASNHVKLVVPCTTTVKELMQNLGCTNSEAKKNKLHEIQEAGNGRWVKGITIAGDEKDKVKKSIKDFGWDKSRTGAPGERPVVWLWCTKD